ncbi:hypothetical protein [Hymenobacter arizonensis]|uniref:Uncharacterized protein n=1 Tax=Hymenobacter arizonensis TaxID=1227077 RepID=A0A1I6BQP9_HYMAR|nr:hypothetical protein [Hymenobacter arizonensis]SFQ83260.1 hypothetical protein SAMN04515668_4936 [Hymenobacter arizonensis]
MNKPYTLRFLVLVLLLLAVVAANYLYFFHFDALLQYLYDLDTGPGDSLSARPNQLLHGPWEYKLQAAVAQFVLAVAFCLAVKANAARLHKNLYRALLISSALLVSLYGLLIFLSPVASTVGVVG